MKIREQKRSNLGDKDLNYYMNLEYPITLEEFEEAGKKKYAFSIPDLPGCGAEGDTLEEARRRLEEAKEDWISVSLDEKLPIPEPVVDEGFSGKFLLRISPKLHMILSKNAEREGKSLNQHIRSILETKANQNNKVSEMVTALKAYMQDEFNILSQRLTSLETRFNNISDSIRELRPYSYTFGQTDAVEIYDQAIQSIQLDKIAMIWQTGQAFQKEEEAI